MVILAIAWSGTLKAGISNFGLSHKGCAVLRSILIAACAIIAVSIPTEHVGAASASQLESIIEQIKVPDVLSVYKDPRANEKYWKSVEGVILPSDPVADAKDDIGKGIIGPMVISMSGYGPAPKAPGLQCKKKVLMETAVYTLSFGDFPDQAQWNVAVAFNKYAEVYNTYLNRGGLLTALDCIPGQSSIRFKTQQRREGGTWRE
jgi:hypothetical protein